VLTDQLHIKRINFLDILNDESGADPTDVDEQFDIEFALMTGELSLLLAGLVKALDGEKAPEG
jgi:recombination associated protein RdgC